MKIDVTNRLAFYTILTTASNYGSNEMKDGKIISPTQLYYVGLASKFDSGGSLVDLNVNQAYLMKFDSSGSCYPFTDAIPSSSNWNLYTITSILGSPNSEFTDTVVTLQTSTTITVSTTGTTVNAYPFDAISFNHPLTACVSTTFVVNPSTLADQTYNIGSGSTTFSFSPFTITSTNPSSCTCSPFTYSYVTTQPFISLSTTTFTLSTTDINLVGTYPITVTGTCADTSATLTFNFILVNLCPSQIITPLSPGDQTYNLNDPTLSFSFTSWTLPLSYCGPFSYTASTTAPPGSVSATVPSFMTGPVNSASTGFTV